MKKFCFFSLMLVSIPGFSQADTSLVKYLSPALVHATRGYSQAVEVDLGNAKMVIISGQIALDKNGMLVGKGNVTEQTEQVFTNIKNIVAESGGTMDDVVRICIFMIDITQVQAMRNVRNTFFNQQKPPKSTLVQVSKLVRDDLLIEIEATVIIPKKGN